MEGYIQSFQIQPSNALGGVVTIPSIFQLAFFFSRIFRNRFGLPMEWTIHLWKFFVEKILKIFITHQDQYENHNCLGLGKILSL